MTRNPVINALAGLLYVVLVASLMFFTSGLDNKVPSIFIPITVLSLFVFSAGLMSYLFVYQPLQLFLEGEKKQAVDLFLKTLAAFAVSAAALVLVGLYLTASRG